MVSAAISGAKPKTMQDLSFALPTSSSSSDKVKFGEIMNMTLSGNAYNNNKASVESSANAQKSTDIRESGGKTGVLSNTAENVEATDNAETAERLPEKLEVSEEEFQEDVVEAALDVVDAIEEEFNVSEEEILAAMQSLGMTVNDLLSPQSVTKLLESITQTDSLTFITDGDMMSKLNEVLMAVQAGIEGIAKANGLDVETADHMIADMDLTGKEKFVFETFRQHAADEETPQNLNLHSDGKAEMMPAGESVAKDEVRPDVKEVPLSDEEPVSDEEQLKEAFAEKITVKTEETAKDSGNAETQNRDSNKNTFAGRHEGVENIAQNLSQSVHKVFSEVIADKTAMIDEADIVRQVVDSVKLTAGRQMKTIEVMLNPDNLGKVHIAVTAREGAVTAQIIAQNEQVKAALENQMIALKEHFDNQGIKVDAVEVTVQSHAFEANQNFDGNSHNSQSEKKTHRPLNLSSLEELDEDEMSIDELRARDSLVNGESSVVYTA